MEHTTQLTGFADEAAPGIEGQIRATRELGWSAIEARAIDGQNIHDLSEEAFEAACARLAEEGVRINCFGSAIANWGKQITDPFEITLAEVRRAIPRMQLLGTRLIRIMSYAVLEGREPEDQMAEERFGWLRELVRLFGDAGITAVHENCMNYGGMGWPYTLRLLENVPGIKLVFDTGNPVFNEDRSQPRPYPKQSAWEFYTHVRPFIEHVHVKDCIFDPATGTTQYTWPGEGHGDVRKILKDLLEDGYRGAISIEPHMQVVFHDASVSASEEAMASAYIEYDRRLEALIEEIRAEIVQDKKM